MATITVGERFVNIEQWHEGAETTLVVLHGFTGTAKSWHALAQRLPDVHVVAVDLIGHGASDIPETPQLFEMDVQLQLLHDTFEKLQLSHFALLGYSMGGRIALSYAARYPQQIRKLLLESSSPGLKTEQERLARVTSDEELAQFIETAGITAFVDKWENIPLFVSQKKLPINIQQAIREERLSQSTLGLANSLRGIGTGKMPSLWDVLSMLPMPVHLFVGQLDKKFVGIAQQMQNQLANAEITEFIGCGHAIHVENLPQFATIVKESISN